MNEDDNISISEAAGILNISEDTLRRWDKEGKLVPIRSIGGKRIYSRTQVEIFLDNLFISAQDWTIGSSKISDQMYCENSGIFLSRLTRMQDLLGKILDLQPMFSLIVSITGEMGDNSFAHNLGKWPDVQGIFFGYDIHKRHIVLADRGVGILATLKRVKPELQNDEEAMKVAFTEVISGRAPEARGNGLKLVRKVVSENPIGVLFRTGDAELILSKDSSELDIHKNQKPFRGCLAVITF